MKRCSCYLRGTTWLGLFNTIIGCLFNCVLVRLYNDDTNKTLAWYFDYADRHPREGE